MFVGESWMLTGEMSRHTTFKFCLDPTVEQHDVLARHAGRPGSHSTSAYGCENRAHPTQELPGHRRAMDRFDLIHAFNA